MKFEIKNLTEGGYEFATCILPVSTVFHMFLLVLSSPSFANLTRESMLAIMSEEKKSDLDRLTFNTDTLRKYFPKSYTPQQMESTILKLLETWARKRQKEQER